MKAHRGRGPSMPMESLQEIGKKTTLVSNFPQTRYKKTQNKNGCILDISAKERTGSSYQVQVALQRKTFCKRFGGKQENGREENRKAG